MATKIVTKNSSTASAVPTASDLVQGELAVNVADKKLFTEDNSGAIIELADGVKLAGIEASADVTDTANVTAAGALMDSELTSIASVKALNQGVATTDSPAFAGLTVDTDTLAVDSTNNRVGIGTASPVTDLDVRNNISMGDGTSVTNLSMTRNSANYITASNATGYLAFRTGGSTERMRIDSSGNLLVGTTSTAPSTGGHALRIGANSYAFISHASSVASGNYYIGFRHGTSNIGAIVQNGTTGVLYNTSSDQRLKENIADADDAGSKIDAIQVRKYDWKADGSHQDYGMIAQELQTVAPEAVSGDADSEEMMGVDYSKLVPMLIKEIQSLRNRVAQLEE